MMLKQGIYAALVTPFTKTGEVDYCETKKLVRHLINQNIEGFYVCGSTGEAFILSMDERKRILETVLEENNGQKPVVCHCGTISTSDMTELSRHATCAGADAVSAIPPFYYKFSEAEIISHYRTLTESTQLPVIIYNFPEFSGVEFTMELFDKLLDLKETVVSIKHTSFDLYMLERLKTRYPDSIIFNGRDEILFSGLIAGADGAIGSTYNAIPKVALKVQECYRKKEIAGGRKAQSYLNDFIDMLNKYGTMQVVKEFLTYMDIQCNGVRSPFRQISEDGKNAVADFYRNYKDSEYAEEVI